jgi:NADP-dependent 3-hydroxy acid dehydrogenase YdfG
LINSGKTVLITGSSSGVGKATAQLFQEKGWNVIATMRTPEKEKKLVELDNVLVTRLDVTDLDSINSAIESGIKKFGKIDVLVNNAGYGAMGPLEAFPIENIKRIFDTNIVGLIYVTREFLSHFRENRSGIIINISSISGKVSSPFFSLYTATKFSEALLYELEDFNVKVKIIEPGAIATNFLGSSLDLQNGENVPAEYQSKLNVTITVAKSLRANAASASSIAEVIYQAATDGSNKLRYTAGNGDAEYILEDFRKNKTDDEIIEMIKKLFYGENVNFNE